MSKKTDAAFQEAQTRIAKALATNADFLDLGLRNLIRIPDEITQLTALMFLDLSGTKVGDLAPLSTLTALSHLGLFAAGVSDLAPISKLTALTSLNLAYTQVSDLALISKLTALTSLNISRTQVSDLAPISALTALASLELADTKVSDLAPISSLGALTQLISARTQVNNLAPISSLTALTGLDLADTPVSDLAPISDLTSLASLDLSDTQVSDLRSIREIRFESEGYDAGFNGLRFDRIPAVIFDPNLARLAEIEDSDERTEQTLAYLNGLDDVDYDRRLAEWRAAQAGVASTEEPPSDTDLSARIEAALRGPILKDAIADLHPSNGAFTAGPVNGRAARPIDRPYEELVDTLAFAARRLSDGEAQNRLSRAVVECFADYLDQVGLPDLNPRLLQFLAASIGGALKDEHALAALDGMDIARMQTFLAEHDNLIRSYYPDVLIPLSYSSDTDPGKLVKELPALVAAVTADIAKGTEAGLFLPPVSDVQEALVRAEEGARRGYLTALPEGQAEAGRALQKLAVAEAGFIGRVALRLRQSVSDQAQLAKRDPLQATMLAEFAFSMVQHAQNLWALVAPYLHLPF